MSVVLEISSLKKKLIYSIRQRSERSGTFQLEVKGTLFDPEGASVIGELGAIKLADFEFRAKVKIQGIGGLGDGAGSMATAVSLRALERGLKWAVFAGGVETLPKGAKIIVVEDVITTGEETLKTIERLKAEGYAPVAVLALVDDERGAEEAFEKQGMKLLTILKHSEILEV